MWLGRKLARVSLLILLYCCCTDRRWPRSAVPKGPSHELQLLKSRAATTKDAWSGRARIIATMDESKLAETSSVSQAK
jgi:hypothetical protein